MRHASAERDAGPRCRGGALGESRVRRRRRRGLSGAATMSSRTFSVPCVQWHRRHIDELAPPSRARVPHHVVVGEHFLLTRGN